VIFTFYSYKGGVGRSMALANVARCLYLRGARVVMIDWDLEAPGLESFFFAEGQELDAVGSQLGLIDILVSYREQFARWVAPAGRDEYLAMLREALPPIRHFLYPVEPPRDQADGHGPALWLLPAGWRAGDRFPAYAQAVQSFDWAEFYERYRGEEYFEWLRRQLLDDLADVVLIDSRTGVTEMGGVCTRHLADVVVAFCVPNLQNLTALDMMARSFTRDEVLRARRRPLDIVVVPSRIESEADARDRFQNEFRHLLDVHTPETFRRLGTDFWRLAIPYIPRYAHFEELAIGVPGAAEELTSAYERLAAHLAMMSPECSAVRRGLAAEIDREFGDSLPRVCLICEPVDGGFTATLRARLEALEPGLALWPNRPDPTGGLDWWRSTVEALDHVEIAVPVVTSASRDSPLLRRAWQYARQQGVCLFAVTDGGLDFASLPRWMRKARFFDPQTEWPALVRSLKGPCRAARVPFMAPPLPADFSPRWREFESARNLMLGVVPGHVDVTTTALYGTGGMGKTTLAIALCHDGQVMEQFDDGILWVTLGEQPDILDGLTKLHAALTADRPTFRDVEEAAARLAAKLKGKDCLLVLDDVWERAHLEPFLSAAPGCARLVTTRVMEVATDADRVVVAGMSPDEAIQMLAKRLDPRPEDLEALRGLAQRLGGWPLVLGVVGAALRRRLAHGDTLEGAVLYLERFLDLKGILAFDRADLSSPRQSISHVIERSLAPLTPGERRRLLELAIFPAAIDIPLAVVRELWAVDDFEAEALAQRLCDFALLDLDLPGQSVRLHDVIRAYLASRLTDVELVHARLLDAWGAPHRLPHHYSWRWIAYHLKGAGRLDELRDLVLDYGWIRAKLDATDPDSLLADFDYLPREPDVSAVQGAIRLSAHVLAGDHAHLRSQLVGRLLAWERSGRPEGPTGEATSAARDGDSARPAGGSRSGVARPTITALLARAHHWDVTPWLRPRAPGLVPPGGALVRLFDSHWTGVRAVALMAHGRRMASASDDGTLILWHLERAQPLRVLRGDGRGIGALAVLPAGRRAVSGGPDGRIHVWDLEAGRVLSVLDGPGGPIGALSALPGGRLALSGASDGTIVLWDLAIGRACRTIQGPDHPAVNAVAVMPGGRWAVSGADDGAIILWDLDHFRALRTVGEYGDPVLAVAITPDGRRITAGSSGGVLRAWDLHTGRETQAYKGHRGAIRAVAVTPDGRGVVSAGEDGTVRAWDLRGGHASRTLGALGDGLGAVAITADGRRVVSGSEGGLLHLWDFQAGEEPSTPPGRSGAINVLAITPDGHSAISAATDGTLRVWDLAGAREVRAYRGPGTAFCAMEVTAGGGGAATASADGKFLAWDLQTGRCSSLLECDGGAIRAMAVTAGGRRGLSGSDDGRIRLWDLEAGRLLCVLGGHRDAVPVLAASADGSRAVSASLDRTIRIWDLEAGRCSAVLEGGGCVVRALAMTADGRRGLSGSDDGRIRLWDLEAGRSLGMLQSNGRAVLAIALTHDGRLAASTSSDRTIRLWDLETGHDLASFVGDDAFASCVFAPDGMTIVVGDSAGRLHILQLEGFNC
jgi:WD40 repeat protein